MTKGTKAFRIIVCILLALTMLWSAFIGLGFIAFGKVMRFTDEYGIWVAGVAVTRRNKGDILGDGTVSYNASYNMLIFNNADIEVDYAAVQSNADLRIVLVGENKFVCKNNETISAIYAAENYNNKNISFEGDGSLILEMQNINNNMQGIVGSNVVIAADVTVTTADCSNIVNGIVCNSSLILVNGATLTINNGTGKHSMALRVRGNVLLEEGTALNVSVGPGAVENCKGLTVNGDLILGKNTNVNVSIDDQSAAIGECIRVTGLIDIGEGSKVTASAKDGYAIECYGSVKANKDVLISATTEGNDADIICYGAFVNYGATVNADVDALGDVHNRAED